MELTTIPEAPILDAYVNSIQGELNNLMKSLGTGTASAIALSSLQDPNTELPTSTTGAMATSYGWRDEDLSDYQSAINSMDGQVSQIAKLAAEVTNSSTSNVVNLVNSIQDILSGVSVYKDSHGVQHPTADEQFTIIDQIDSKVSGVESALQAAHNQMVQHASTVPTPNVPNSNTGSSTQNSPQNSGYDNFQPDYTVPSGGSTAGNEQILQQAAAQFGWGSGSQWEDLIAVENREAGFEATAQNSSGALGIAQALGHGTSDTAGSEGNEYGGYGLTAAQAQAANSGDATDQALWMVNYIKDTYGSPAAALAH